GAERRKGRQTPSRNPCACVSRALSYDACRSIRPCLCRASSQPLICSQASFEDTFHCHVPQLRLWMIAELQDDLKHRLVSKDASSPPQDAHRIQKKKIGKICPEPISDEPLNENRQVVMICPRFADRGPRDEL
ncbi:hypothetical protein CEXT_505431, partial [Caerostris extrusa]